MVGIAPIGITRVVSAERLSTSPLYKALNAASASERVLKDGSIAVAIYKGVSKLASKFLVFKKGTNLDGDLSETFLNLIYSKDYFTKKKKKEGIIEKTIEKITYKKAYLTQDSDTTSCYILDSERIKNIKRFFNKKNELLATVEYNLDPQNITRRKTSTAEGIKDAQNKRNRTIREYFKANDNESYEFKEYANGRRIYKRDSVKLRIRRVFDTVKGFFEEPSRYDTKAFEVKDSQEILSEKKGYGCSNTRSFD